MDEPLNPGSPQAIAAGCGCPVIDNGHGKGCGWSSDHEEPLFVIEANCVLHGLRQKYETQQEGVVREVNEAVERLVGLGLVDPVRLGRA